MRIYLPLFIALFLHTQAAFSQSTPGKIKVRKPAPSADPRCSASLIGRRGGNIAVFELKRINNLYVNGPCDYKIESFIFSASVAGALREFKSEDGVLSVNARAILLSLKPGQKFFIDKILVKSNSTGDVFFLSSLKFSVVQ